MKILHGEICVRLIESLLCIDDYQDLLVEPLKLISQQLGV